MTRRLITGPSNDLRIEHENLFSDLLDKQACLILMPSMDHDATCALLDKYYPSLRHLMDKIIKLYETVNQAFCDNSSPSVSGRNRLISLRDLLRFCSRIQRLSDNDSQAEILFLHAVDCFVAHFSDVVKQFSLCCLIAGELNMTVEKPSVSDTHWPFASTRLACTLLERLAVAVAHQEPVLLVGETGTGKTTAVQRLAQLCGRHLRVINLNQQSDSVDLMGGFKPVDTRALIRPLREQFESLFFRTFKTDTNLAFLGHINTCFNENRWRDLLTLMRHPTQMAIAKWNQAQSAHSNTADCTTAASTLTGWTSLLQQLNQVQLRLDASTKANQPALGFAFIEGALVRSIQDGDWVLLDEVNLAPPEMLNCLSGLLDSSTGSVTLIERGDKTPLRRNPHFHLFAAMNPSTDVGKRELPVGLRNRFTEIYVPELNPGLTTDTEQVGSADIGNCASIRGAGDFNDREDLSILTRAYLVALNPTPAQVTTIVRLYAALRQAASEGLVDGVGQRPHFSLRTLCRALIEAGRGYHGSTVRSLYEGLIFSFGSQIGRVSRPILDTLIRRYLALTIDRPSGQSRALDQLLAIPLPMPSVAVSSDPKSSSPGYVNVEGYWIPRGPNEPRSPEPITLCDGSYILTPTVRSNLKDLARVVAAGGSLPILIQGETSVGKTSLITYLATRVGQVCYRINNHEHTDQQTYLGTYTVASATAQTKIANSESELSCPPPLVFQEGPLVQAMRAGHWIILDELNLAPTEILEALNRVLDDNRTLFIPETQETIKAHPHFRLFATQNPPGLYAGRKLLSRALRNRFVELHFDPLPRDELEVILEKRCALPASRAHRLVEVLHRLQVCLLFCV
ncbi:unnamed protein product [Echinostoma caproni]|uniref:Midasin n=1 Tax=Echinostoma caproni TaxID=27848 RepID=A0A183AR04_9TREM|nr:unnamed protein product [Echinostoma caproni]